ncbi:MAG: redoxin domain-containing protein [Candidatus Marinimicrobia bacterium]|nr:redoxin domain-containing protein [Candidatus Neomarinimicrobiota bacterium]MCF7827436.1 redoxin domain-containing protein [Candidatus Neomarinimicrobiota bacterium]MCF7882311.1 redoxin domain-containing protein [Candidatus Neomarinimicrobiota bacterium]
MTKSLSIITISCLLITGIYSCADSGGTQENQTKQTVGTVQPEDVSLVPVNADSLMQIIQSSPAKVTVLNVWATWCQPCREEFPDMLKAYRETKDKGVSLMLVSGDFPDQKLQAKQFLAEHGVGFTTYFKTGKDMPFINALSSEWTGALPATFIYDENGNLQQFWQGKASYDEFVNAINEAL